MWSGKDDGQAKAGVWGTPGIVGDLVIYTTYTGRVIGVDRATGAVRWEKRLTAPLMGVAGDRRRRAGSRATATACCTPTTCATPLIDPPELWNVPLGGCIESTPAVWKGRIYVGTRGGFLHAIGDA